MIPRPKPTDCNEYYFLYIDQVPEGDVLQILSDQIDGTISWLEDLPAERLGYRYAPGKWSVKEVIGHVIDVERAFQFRAFCAARNEPAPLPSFEENDYAAISRYDERPLGEIIAEFRAVRQASLVLFYSFNEEEWARKVNASGFDFKTNSFPYILAGHEIHHLKVLQERYL